MIKKVYLDTDVVQMARERIIRIFDNGVRVRLSTSGGKDSIVLTHIIYQLVLEGKINPEQLEVAFVDEEAMFDEVIEIVEIWRRRFMELGVEFKWFAMEFKHFNCLNSLESDESFITWDRHKKDVWVRKKPRWAITSHPLHLPRKDTYQEFFDRYDRANGNITIMGMRVAESLHRMQNIAKQKRALTGDFKSSPIYDMEDTDVWMYIKRYNLEYPDVYENLWRLGTSLRNLRISQFFSIDTARVLIKLNEMYPDLMKRVERREPNAYLIALYWDTDMFGGRRTKEKKKKEAELKDGRTYEQMFYEVMNNPHMLATDRQREDIPKYRNLMLLFGEWTTENIYKRMYEALTVGDPKGRSFRAIQLTLAKERTKGDVFR